MRLIIRIGKLLMISRVILQEVMELIWEMFLMRYWKENYAKQWNM